MSSISQILKQKTRKFTFWHTDMALASPRVKYIMSIPEFADKLAEATWKVLDGEKDEEKLSVLTEEDINKLESEAVENE